MEIWLIVASFHFLLIISSDAGVHTYVKSREA